MFRIMGAFDIPRTGLAIAANVQALSGKPWAATDEILLNQGIRRILLEPRGTRRLPSQTLFDLRVSRGFVLSDAARVELIFDVLNALNDSAAEDIATDSRFSPNFNSATVFLDPRRLLISARLTLGR
jgi:hypothetical protein